MLIEQLKIIGLEARRLALKIAGSQFLEENIDSVTIDLDGRITVTFLKIEKKLNDELTIGLNVFLNEEDFSEIIPQLKAGVDVQ